MAPKSSVRQCVPALTLLILLAVSPRILAQSSGSVTGMTTDSTHAVVPGATLRLTNTATSVSMLTESNGDGLFHFTSVEPGSYELRATAKGFSDRIIQGIVVEVARTTQLNIEFSVGSTVQRVVVNAATQSLDTDNGYKGQIITSREIENLPLPSRNPLALTTLTPGVVAGTGGTTTDRQASDGTSITDAYEINGGVRTNVGGFNEYLVDGISMTNKRDGTVQALPSEGSIQEFQVQSGGLPPALGNTVGGVINYVTKAGTNEYHGLLFEDYRGTDTTTRPELPAGAPAPVNIFNQFGGNIGGPLWMPKLYNRRNKTFVFVDYEGSRWVRQTPMTVTIPTALMHQGIFTDVKTTIYDPASSTNPATRTAFPNQTIPPGLINPIGAKIMNLIPMPNLPGTANNFAGDEDVFTPLDIITARIDQNIGERHRLGFKLSRVDSTSIATFPLGPNDQSTQNIVFPTRNYTGFYDFFITPTLTYSLAAGYTHFTRDFFDTSGNTVGAGYFGYTVSPAPVSGSFANVRPLATFDIYRGVGTGAPQNQVALTDQLNQSIRWSIGKHFLTFGNDLRRYHASGLVSAGDPNGSFGFSSQQTSNGTSSTGNSAAALLLGLPNTEIIQQEPNISLANYVNAFYVSDDFKVLPNLTLNLGVRYQYETSLTEATNKSGWFDPTTVNPLVNVPGVFRYAGLNGTSPKITAGDYDQIAPRVGFAYSPTFWRGATVIRGAFGLIHAPVPSVGFYAPSAGFDATLNPIKANATASAGTLTTSYTLPAAAGQQGDAAFLGLGITAPLNRFAKSPHVYQWNFGIQQELPNNFLFEIQYSANRADYLLATENIDLPNYSVIQAAITAEKSAGGKAGTAEAYLNQLVPNPLAGKVPGTLGASKITLENASLSFPQFSSATVLKDDRGSNYQSLQATLQRRLGTNLNLLFAYTFSKLIDNALEANFNSADQPNIGSWQNPYSLSDARGPSNYDHTHLFAGSGVYALPFGKNQQFLRKGWGNAIMGGFQLTGIVTGQSGVPLAVLQSGANGLGLGSARPDKVGNPQTDRHRNPNGSVQWINPAAYALVDGRFGTAPIRDGTARGPQFWDADLGLQRTFHLYERLNLQFRGEAFNAFNHANLELPIQDVSSPSFGQINGVYNTRWIQIDGHLQF